MRLVEDARKPREYPHLVTLGRDRNVRWLIDVANAPMPPESRRAHSFHAPGAIDPAGEITTAGRRAILDRLRAKAGETAATTCVVWSPISCTYVTKDGTVDGREPPKGEPVYPDDYSNLKADLRSVRWIRLPEECAWPFLCVRKLDRDHAEICSGEPMILGHFDELPEDGPGSELRRHLAADGSLVPPAVFRGVTTTGVANGFTLLGPIQPNGCEIRVVAPWPQEVFAAANEIAGTRLPSKLLEALWRAVDPLDSDVLEVGVREAA